MRKSEEAEGRRDIYGAWRVRRGWMKWQGSKGILSFGRRMRGRGGRGLEEVRRASLGVPNEGEKGRRRAIREEVVIRI